MRNAYKLSITIIVLIATAISLAVSEVKIQDAAETTTREYVVDTSHSNVIFKIRHNGIANFYGRFNQINGSIQFDKDKIENSSMSFTVPTESVDGKSDGRNKFIKGANFFDIIKYPEASFTSTSIKPLGEGVYSLTGEFTLLGTTKTIEAKMLDVRTGKVRRSDGLGIEVRFTFKRSDYGLTALLDKENPEAGGLGDSIDMIVAIEAIAK